MSDLTPTPNSAYVAQAEQNAEMNATDARRAKRITLDSEKLFDKKLRNLVFEQLNGNITFNEQFKKQQELLKLKSEIENFGSVIKVVVGKQKELSMKEKQEMHHLAKSNIYTQKEVADIFDTNQAQVSRYANKEPKYFDKEK